MQEQLSNKIVRDIKQKILSGALRIGDRLPSERELAETYNVSRITIRNAISQLAYKGFLQTIPQSGTFIADFKKNASLDLLFDVISNDEEVNRSILIELMETRRMLETFTAGRAAIKMNEKDRKKIKALVETMNDNKDNPEQLAEIDYEIHSLLIEFAGNNILRLLFNSFKPVYRFYLRLFYSLPENAVGILPYYERYCNVAELQDDRIASFVMNELLYYAEQGTFKIIGTMPSIKTK